MRDNNERQEDSNSGLLGFEIEKTMVHDIGNGSVMDDYLMVNNVDSFP